jgi:ParB-like chromosome segregation protein Spo0J
VPKPAIIEVAAEMVDPAKLKPWAGNPRKNDGEPVAKVAESIKRFGFAAPIVARKATGEIIAGHTRWKAARQLKLKKVPVRYMNLTESEARLLALADNRLGELADWDETQLLEVLGGYDSTDALLAGWSGADIEELEAGLGEEEGEGLPSFDLFDRERLASAHVAALCGKKHGEFARLPPDVMVALNRCAAGRAAALSTLTDRWFPHRYDVRAGAARYTPNEQLGLPEMIRAASRMGTGVMKSWGSVPELLNHICLTHGGQCARQFPIDQARDIYKEFTQPGAAVLDPCAGWGGRLLGWLCARRGGRYQGYDASKATVIGFTAMLVELGINDAAVHHAAFEDVQLEPESFDFAFTSPPYFTLERYGEDPEQAEQRYASYPAWLEGFFAPLLERTLAALRPGCCFALNVSDHGELALAKDAARIARAAGASCEPRSITLGPARSLHDREESDVEDLLVLRKPEASRHLEPTR